MVTITNDSKNSLSITNDSKFRGLIWDEATMTWTVATFTWDFSGLGLMIFLDSKNNLTITNDIKN